MEKKRSHLTSVRPHGILQMSTLLILASGAVTLTSCDRGVEYVVTEKDVTVAKVEKELKVIDTSKNQLLNGLLANNFHLEGVGYYHAGAHNFFEHAYNHKNESGNYFVNGQWDISPGPTTVEDSRPSPEALKKLDAALTKDQTAAAAAAPAQPGTTPRSFHHHSGFSPSSMLMMYWLLNANRNSYRPGSGFDRMATNLPTMQRRVDEQREETRQYRNTNAGYRSVSEQLKQSPTPVQKGQVVRNGFGTSPRRSSFFGG